MADKIEQKFQKKGLKLTDQRRTIARVILESKEAYGESDHPDVDELYNRVSKIDPKISIATVYRTVKLFEEAGILTKHDFNSYLAFPVLKSCFVKIPASSKSFTVL